MSVVIVTGSAGLIGAEAVRLFAGQGLDVVGIDNDMRREYFGDEASTAWSRRALAEEFPNYRHFDVDIRDRDCLDKLFDDLGTAIQAVVHTAAQPSHDWAARDPFTDFDVNASGTLNLLEMTRRFCPEAVFLFTSTNKVYGDAPNRLPLEELDQRYELSPSHAYGEFGIDESMSIDQTTHSLFGASKSAADLLVQEYGRYFGLRSAVFRGGCLTGPGHSGTQLHGFLAYLVKCAISNTPYVIFGYKGKQVRDNIHSRDLVSAFWHFFQEPRVGEVYNIGGGRHSNCSILEAISYAEKLSGRSFDWSYQDENRVGDHMWWISDVRKFQSHYPDWQFEYDHERIMTEVYEGLLDRRDDS
jgi:CDP-paratose 2-epimerase